ncbi:MAG: hypothetical protein M9910_07775 [Kiritimatiellae bacterium]|nr:hypothetical protein [Kiritimatiellia bacterium]
MRPFGVGLEQASNQRCFGLVHNDGPQAGMVQVADRRASGELAPDQLFPNPSPDVLGEVVHVVFGLPKGNVQHELTLRRVLKPEVGELQREQLADIEQVNDAAPVDRIAGEAVRVPSQNAARLARFDGGKHGVEDGATGFLGGARFYELAGDFELFPTSKLADLAQLRVDREQLPVVLVGGFAGVEKEFHGCFSLIGLPCVARVLAMVLRKAA